MKVKFRVIISIIELKHESFAWSFFSGKPALVRYHVLNNKRYVLTQDSEGVVAKWDVLTGVKHSVIGPVSSFDEEIKNHFQFIFVPSWFSVDLKTGYLCVHIDEVDCMQS